MWMRMLPGGDGGFAAVAGSNEPEACEGDKESIWSRSTPWPALRCCHPCTSG
jgi:hypothetical protein